MTVIDLSKYLSTAKIDGPGIRLDDYEVCKLLQPFMLAVVSTIERADLLVGRIEITPEFIRAYALVEESDHKREHAHGGLLVNWWPDFAQKKLPRGLFAHLVDVSSGPIHPFPLPIVSPDAAKRRDHVIKLVDDTFFPEGDGPCAVVLNAINYADIRKHFRARHDVCTEAARLKAGFMGVLWELEGCAGRSIQIWIKRMIPVNVAAVQFGNSTIPPWVGTGVEEMPTVSFKTYPT